MTDLWVTDWLCSLIAECVCNKSPNSCCWFSIMNSFHNKNTRCKRSLQMLMQRNIWETVWVIICGERKEKPKIVSLIRNTFCLKVIWKAENAQLAMLKWLCFFLSSPSHSIAFRCSLFLSFAYYSSLFLSLSLFISFDRLLLLSFALCCALLPSFFCSLHSFIAHLYCQIYSRNTLSSLNMQC